MEVHHQPTTALAAMAAPWNPRTISNHDLAALRRSLRAFGAVEPVVVNSRSGKIVGGHQRVKAAEAEGLAELPVVYVDLDEAGERQLNIALNRISGQFDDEALASVLQEIEKLDGDLELTGLDEGELSQLLGDPKPGETDPDAAPENVEPRTKRGDMWLLGEHRLFCGDATSQNNTQMLMGSDRYSLLVTDPPYGVSYASKNQFLNAIDKGNRIQTEIENDHQTPAEMSVLWRQAFGTVRAFAASGASYYVTGPQGGDLLLLLLLGLRDSGFPLRHMLVWAKNNHVLGRCDYHYKHEPILFGWVEGAHKFYGERGETSLWEIDRPLASKLHPTMKPVELFARAITNSSARGGIVLDPFLGSGTTLIACEQLARRCFALEIDPTYCDVAVTRWEEFTGKTAELVKGS